MKQLLPAVIAATLISMPFVAWADQNGAPPAPSSAGFQIMEQAHAKVEQLHDQARLSMIASLSPSQRTLLAQVVGQLAIAQTPDPAAAAKTLDANLTQAQAKNVLGISASLEQQAHQIMDAAHKQMQAAMPDSSAPHGQWGMHGMQVMHEGADETDPGMILLSMAARAIHPMGPPQMMMGPPGAPR